MMICMGRTTSEVTGSFNMKLCIDLDDVFTKYHPSQDRCNDLMIVTNLIKEKDAIVKVKQAYKETFPDDNNPGFSLLITNSCLTDRDRETLNQLAIDKETYVSLDRQEGLSKQVSLVVKTDDGFIISLLDLRSGKKIAYARRISHGLLHILSWAVEKDFIALEIVDCIDYSK